MITLPLLAVSAEAGQGEVIGLDIESISLPQGLGKGSKILARKFAIGPTAPADEMVMRVAPGNLVLNVTASVYRCRQEV